MNVLVMISYIHRYVCLYEMCFDKLFHAVCVFGSGSPSSQARGRDTLGEVYGKEAIKGVQELLKDDTPFKMAASVSTFLIRCFLNIDVYIF